MVERSLSMWEVGGSIPPVSKIFFSKPWIKWMITRVFESGMSSLVLWCSGYHICFTRRRSPVRSWAGSKNVFLFYLNNCDCDNFHFNFTYICPASVYLGFYSMIFPCSFPFNSIDVSTTTCPASAFSQCSSLLGTFHKIAFTNLKSSIV